jgi:hypothetical protein
MAASKRQLAANRANSKKSSGPRSQAGKEKVSQNAIQHGLTGSFQVLEGENQDWFDNLFTQLIQDEQPVGAAEVELVRTMAEHIWCSRRASRIQESCFWTNRTPEQIANQQVEVRVNPELERFVRYQAAHDRAYQRASKELQERRKQRMKAEIGFASQKRAEAKETRDAEKHELNMAIGREHLDQEKSKTILRGAAAANELEAIFSPPQGKMAA